MLNEKCNSSSEDEIPVKSPTLDKKLIDLVKEGGGRNSTREHKLKMMVSYDSTTSLFDEVASAKVDLTADKKPLMLN